ncbi:MAG: CpsB/CapC family capsule biosynthesis tyrosine phosphatase [Hungatella sp.]
MESLYDVHCHLIPGVDDGSRDLEESLCALQLAYQQGIRTILCTPHLSGEDTGAHYEKIHTQFTQLADAVQKQSYGSDMELYLGNELYYSDAILEKLKNGQADTMAGSQYVLVEFDPGEAYPVLYRALRNLMNHGYMPILAHMERYRCLEGREQHLCELETMGIYLQVNASALSGSFLNPSAFRIRKLMRQGHIHLLATDSHGTHYRPPRMEAAAAWIRRHCQAEIAERILYENPRRIIADQVI